MRAYRKIDDHYELKIERGRLVLLAVGGGLTLLLVFLVGVLVGKGLWGVKPEPLAVAAAPVAAPGAGAPGESGERPKTDLSFYTTLKSGADAAGPKLEPPPSTLEPVTETAVPAPKATEPQGAASAAGAVPGAAGSEKAPAQAKGVPEGKPADAGKGDAVKKPPAEAAKPPATDKAADLTAKAGAKLPAPTYTIQIGSFRDRASADDQAKKIAAQSVTAQVVLVSMEGRTWFRVQVGRFDTRADAEQHYQKKLRPKGIQGFVTTR